MREKPLTRAKYQSYLRQVAEKYGVTTEEVDRGIAECLDECWKKNNEEFQKLFPDCKRPPTPREGLPVLVARLKAEHPDHQ